MLSGQGGKVGPSPWTPGPPKPPGPPGPLGPPGTPSNLRDSLELPDVIREKHFSGIIISFVYLRGYSFSIIKIS